MGYQIGQEEAEVRRTQNDQRNMQERLKDVESDNIGIRKRCAAVEERLLQAEEECQMGQQRIDRLTEDCNAYELRARELQKAASGSTAKERELESQVEEQNLELERYRELHGASERRRISGESQLQSLETENESLRAELLDTSNERVKINQVLEDVMREEAAKRKEEVDHYEAELDKWKGRANYYEREYTQSKQLNSEMTKVMSQMTMSVSEKSEQTGDVNKQNRTLLKQLEQKTHELKTARQEKEEIQKQFDSQQSMGSYFQEKYKEASNELRVLKQEHSVATASAQKLKGRVELLQQENETMKTSQSKLLQEVRSGGYSPDQAQIEKYEQHLRELQQKILKKDEEMEHSQACFQKSQMVNDCLNTLLSLESAQTNLYESSCHIQDEGLRSEIDSKKTKAQTVIGRLNNIMSEEDDRSSRPNLAYLHYGNR